jgi:hypothetical protein
MLTEVEHLKCDETAYAVTPVLPERNSKICY